MDEDDILRINEMKPKQWAEIKRLAFKIYRSGRYGNDTTKCNIAAFVYWLNSSGLHLSVDVDGLELEWNEH